MKTNELKNLLALYAQASEEALWREHRSLVRYNINQKAKKVVGQISTLNKKTLLAEELVAHERKRRTLFPGTK